MHPGKKFDGKKRIEMQHQSTIRYRLDHVVTVTAARHGYSGGVYTCTLGYAHPYVRPLFHRVCSSPVEQLAPKAVSALGGKVGSGLNFKHLLSN